MIVYLPILLTDHYHLDLQIVGLLYLPIAVSTIAGSVLFKWIQRDYRSDACFDRQSDRRRERRLFAFPIVSLSPCRRLWFFSALRWG
ncbi:hypothetical protein PO124_21120 [Bacillus licheniformis]|nr:hypothetical protein [Bacillus licheniformis]